MTRRLNATALAKRRHDVAKLNLKGMTLAEIGEKLGVDASTVCRDLAWIREQWQKTMVVDYHHAWAIQLAKLDFVEKCCWEAWEGSGHVRETRIVVRPLPDGEGGATVCVANHDAERRATPDNHEEEHRATSANHDQERGAAYLCEKRETEAGNFSELEGVLKCVNKRWKLLEALRPKERRLAPRRNSATRKSEPSDDAPRGEQKARLEGKLALQPMHCVRRAREDSRIAAEVDSRRRDPLEKERADRLAPKGPGSPSRGQRPRGTPHVKDPSGLVPLVNKVEWLRKTGAKTTDPHVLVTWVKEIGGHAQAGEPHSPSGQAGRGLDAWSNSVLACQPRSPAGQAGRGLARDLRRTTTATPGETDQPPSVTRANGPSPSRTNRWPVGPELCFDLTHPQGDALGSENQGPLAQEPAAFHGTKLACFRPTLIYDSGSILRRAGMFKDPSGLAPLVNKVEWLRKTGAKTTDPHVLVTWVKEIGGHAQAGEPHSPSGQAGRGLDAWSISVLACQPRSPAGQAGRGLDAWSISVLACQPRSPAGQAGRGLDAWSISVLACQPHSPSGQAGRGLDAWSISVLACQPRSPAGQAGRGLARLV